MAARPLIGITCYEEEAAWGRWRQPAALLPARYVRALEGVGATCLLVPPQHLSRDEAAELCRRLDGLVVAGGNDVAPAHYGEEPHPATIVASGARDELELELVALASERALPTLAICRGMQVLNVARGGNLIQHLPDVVGHEGHSPTPGTHSSHRVRVRAGSRLAAALGWTEGEVPTHHHQAVGELGKGLRAVATAEDGTVEALEDDGLPFMVAVQWHPEVADDPSLFAALVAAAGPTQPLS